MNYGKLKNLFSTALLLRWVFILDFSVEDKRKCILQSMQAWKCAIKYGWRSFTSHANGKKNPDQSDGSWDG